MSLPMILGLIALYLFVSRCAIGFFYATSKGVDITKSKDRAAFLIPPFGEFLLLWGVFHFLVFTPVSKISGAGVRIHKWREDREVKARALEEQRHSYEMELARIGLKPSDIPSWIEKDDLAAYIQAQRELGIIPEPVDLDNIRKQVQKEYGKVEKIMS